MSFNQVENSILSYAIRNLNKQLKKYNEYRQYFRAGRIYLGDGVIFTLTPENRLTAFLPGTDDVDERLEPVPCYDLMLEGECIAVAVKRLEAEGVI